jgi:ubiquinone/menaquinone biosynthesis C-methylase UbiE
MNAEARSITAQPPPPASSETQTLLCWHCAQPLAPLREECTSAPILCPHCHSVTTCAEGIYQSLSPSQQEAYKRFITEYEFIRSAEGRGSPGPAYYLALPYKDLTGKLAAQWKIRARTFDYLKLDVLPRLPSRILDLGAGNGWLSHRLALHGHSPVAVDLLTNSTDGLGAASHYPTRFPRVQASLDHLPFPSGSYDLALFNASFHYSTSYQTTLAEAIRCVRKGGLIVIADTPCYDKETTGFQMIAEKQEHFRATYGFASNSVPSLEFLTPNRLRSLALAFNLDWQTYKPYYGLQWSFRPVKARLLNRRAPSQFRIFTAEVAA